MFMHDINTPAVAAQRGESGDPAPGLKCRGCPRCSTVG